MVRTACLVCFISTVNGRSNKKRKEEAYPWKAGATSGHITNLKQSILETFDIYVSDILKVQTWAVTLTFSLKVRWVVADIWGHDIMKLFDAANLQMC
jgi:hypothetical protein